MLITLAEVKSYLRIPTAETTEDAYITTLLKVATDFAEKFCQRKFDEAIHTEYYDGDGKSGIILLKQFPVVSITSVHDDTARIFDSVTLVSSSDYAVLAEGILERIDSLCFSKGIQNIKVVYKAGWKAGSTYEPPEDLKQAMIEIVAQKFYLSDKQRQGIQNQSFEGGSVSFFIQELLPETKAVLERYRRIR